MFRSTHDKLVKSLKEDFESRLNTVRQRAKEQELHDEARVQAEKNMVRVFSDENASLKKDLNTANDCLEKSRKQIHTNRPARDVADTFVRHIHNIDKEILMYGSWDELPEEHRETIYDLIYSLIGKPRKSSKKSTKHSV